MSDLLSIYNELQSKKWVDLTHKINAESPHFPALPALKQEDLFTLKDGFHVQKFTVVGQYGTHIDAPIHFVEGGRWLDEIALKDLLLPLYVIDKVNRCINMSSVLTNHCKFLNMETIF